MCKPHKINGNGERTIQKVQNLKVIDEGLEVVGVEREFYAYLCETCNHVLEYCNCELGPLYIGLYE